MDISSSHIKIIHRILEKNLPDQSKVYVFGSRSHKAKKQFSDLDLALDCKTPLSLSTLSSLEYDFSESDLPYKVDIVDLNNVDKNFQEKIIGGMVLFWKKK